MRLIFLGFILGLLCAALAFGPKAKATEISIFDSSSNPKLTWILVDDCAAPVLKAKIKDWCYVSKVVKHFCNLSIKLDKECK